MGVRVYVSPWYIGAHSRAAWAARLRTPGRGEPCRAHSTCITGARRREARTTRGHATAHACGCEIVNKSSLDTIPSMLSFAEGRKCPKLIEFPTSARAPDASTAHSVGWCGTLLLEFDQKYYHRRILLGNKLNSRTTNLTCQGVMPGVIAWPGD